MKWHWKNDQKKLIDKFLKDIKTGCIPEYVVSIVRAGNLCYDLTVLGKNKLCADLYVGGIDSGYGYSDIGYPYDYADAGFLIWDLQSFTDMTCKEFRKFIEEQLTKQINHIEYYYFDGKQIDLIKLANEKLKQW